MAPRNPTKPTTILGPVGRPMTMDDLPPPDTKRWVIRRKAEVVQGVRSGLITLDQACERYTLSREEYLSWERLIEKHGMRGLRVTRTQQYRDREDGDDGAGDLMA